MKNRVGDGVQKRLVIVIALQRFLAKIAEEERFARNYVIGEFNSGDIPEKENSLFVNGWILSLEL